MSAESIGDKKAGDLRHRAEDAMMIGSHFIKSCPRAFRIYCEVLKDGDAVGRMHQDLFDKRAFKIGLESRRLFPIVPGQKKTPAFRAEMETCIHRDDHGR